MPLRLRDALREVEWHVVHLRGHRLADQVGLATRARRVVMQVRFARLAVQVRLGERALFLRCDWVAEARLTIGLCLLKTNKHVHAHVQAVETQ